MSYRDHRLSGKMFKKTGHLREGNQQEQTTTKKQLTGKSTGILFLKKVLIFTKLLNIFFFLHM